MNKLIGVLSLIGTVISVATFAFDLQGRPVSTLAPRTRLAIAVVLAAIGIWSWRTGPPENVVPTMAAALPVVTVTAQPQSTPAGKPVKSAEPRTVRSVPAPALPPRSKILFRGAEDDEMTMLVQHTVGGRPFSGSLEQSCAKDESLEGMITCELTLRMRIADETAFSVDSRGGGFTQRAAERQARERLTPAIEEKIRTWREKT
ncbi:MAG: hypothetical protein ACJ74H_07515 [Thermoanaerobaculia bacterium]